MKIRIFGFVALIAAVSGIAPAQAAKSVSDLKVIASYRAGCTLDFAGENVVKFEPFSNLNSYKKRTGRFGITCSKKMKAGKVKVYLSGGMINGTDTAKGRYLYLNGVNNGTNKMQVQIYQGTSEAGKIWGEGSDAYEVSVVDGGAGNGGGVNAGVPFTVYIPAQDVKALDFGDYENTFRATVNYDGIF